MTHPYERMTCGHFARFEIGATEDSAALCALCEIKRLESELAVARGEVDLTVGEVGRLVGLLHTYGISPKVENEATLLELRVVSEKKYAEFWKKSAADWEEIARSRGEQNKSNEKAIAILKADLEAAQKQIAIFQHAQELLIGGKLE